MTQKTQWDVFVSHNRRQKQWSGKLVAQLRDLGIKVFFDEDSIKPGEQIPQGIERGLLGSRRVLLILTPDSVASPWVASETAATLHHDPDARQQRLIPVLLQPIDREKCSLAVQSVRWVDLTNPQARRQEYHDLLKFLEVSEGIELPDPPALEADDAAAETPSDAEPDAAVAASGTTAPDVVANLPCHIRIDLELDESAENRNWSLKNERFQFVDDHRSQGAFTGEAIVGDPSPYHRVSGQFRTSIFRKTKLTLTVCVTRLAKLSLAANGVVMGSPRSLDPGTASRPRLHTIKLELSRLAELRRVTQFEVIIEYDGKPGGFTIPVKSSIDTADATGALLPPVWQSCLPNLRSIRVAMFGGTCVLNMFLITVWVAINLLPPIRHLGLIYPELWVLVGWLGFVTGSGFAFKPRTLLAVLRYITGLAGYWRIPLSLALLVLAAYVAFYDGDAMCAVRQRIQYTRLINQYFGAKSSDAPLRDAFRLNPWRIEAQILLDRHALSRGHQRPAYIIELCESDHIKWVTKTDLAPSRKYLDMNEVDYSNDPLLWYAGLRSRADTGLNAEQREKARDALDQSFKRNASSVTVPQNRMRLLVHALLEFEIHSMHHDDLAATAGSDPNRHLQMARRDVVRQYYYLATIIDLGERISLGELRRSHFYQEACDKLAQYEFYELHDAELAVNSFAKIVEARQHRADYRDLPWTRTPESLMLFYLFEVKRGSGPAASEVWAAAAEMLDREKANSFPALFDKRFGIMLQGSTQNPLSKDTAAESTFYTRGNINELLQEGWRY